MAGYLCNTTDCDHCENEHNKPNKDALNVSVRIIRKDLYGTNAVKVFLIYKVNIFLVTFIPNT